MALKTLAMALGTSPMALATHYNQKHLQLETVQCKMQGIQYVWN